MLRPVLIVGGAPKINIDAVRYLSVHASGKTACILARQLKELEVSVLLPLDVAEAVQAVHAPFKVLSYSGRDSLEQALDSYLLSSPEAVIVMTAAVNDYEFDYVSARIDGQDRRFEVGEKVPSGALGMSIHLRPASKLIDTLVRRGHQGPLVACKYETASSVIDSAQRLRQRVAADLVLANSLCGTVQALVSSAGCTEYPNRDAIIAALGKQIRVLAASN